MKSSKGKMKRKLLDNDAFVKKNFERLVKKYPHQRIVICLEEIFTGTTAIKEAKRKYPKAIPMALPVPGHEEFSHILVIL